MLCVSQILFIAYANAFCHLLIKRILMMMMMHRHEKLVPESGIKFMVTISPACVRGLKVRADPGLSAVSLLLTEVKSQQWAATASASFTATMPHCPLASNDRHSDYTARPDCQVKAAHVLWWSAGAYCERKMSGAENVGGSFPRSKLSSGDFFRWGKCQCEMFGTVQGNSWGRHKCLDVHAGFQVATCSSCDLCLPV